LTIFPNTAIGVTDDFYYTNTSFTPLRFLGAHWILNFVAGTDNSDHGAGGQDRDINHIRLVRSD